MRHRRSHSIRAWPVHERPREKMLDAGPERLSDAELLAVVFPTAARGAPNAVDQARAWLERFGSLRGLVDAPVRALRATPGIGAARAVAAQALGELARRYGQQRLARGMPLRTSAEVYRHCGERLAALRKEQFHVILLDGKNRPLKDVRVSEGTLTASLVHPREVFVPVIEESAAAIILVHNHPSGDPTPSAEDIAITHRLREVGELMGVRVLDHVIIGHGRYVSFSDEGL
ncbi:MAG: DNA repair protein RadC [Deltaproteobacteria bacterium]|nr:DNA repair protein RadC [Deltaproteobacteria bacterium]